MTPLSALSCQRYLQRKSAVLLLQHSEYVALGNSPEFFIVTFPLMLCIPRSSGSRSRPISMSPLTSMGGGGGLIFLAMTNFYSIHVYMILNWQIITTFCYFHCISGTICSLAYMVLTTNWQASFQLSISLPLKGSKSKFYHLFGNSGF